MCGFTTGYLDRMNFNYTVRCSTTYECVFACNCHVLVMLLLRCYLAVSVAAVLLLCVRHRVSGDTICCRSSLRLIPVFSLSPFKHVLFSMCPLAVLSHVRPRFTYNTSFSYILGNYGHARSHGGRQPAAVKPVLYVRIEYVYTCIHISVHSRMRWG